MTITATATNGTRPQSHPPDPQPPAKVNNVRPARTDRGLVWGFGALIALGTLVVLVSFALSFHGLYEFARTIVHLPHEFSLTVPLALDLFSLVAMFAAFLTHDAPWKVRAYCWAIVCATVGVSVTANAIYAWNVLETFGATRYAIAAVAVAALWPILAALSLHLIILAWRHLKVRRRVVEPSSLQSLAVQLAQVGASTPNIAKAIEVPERTVQHWTKGARDALDALAKSQSTTDALEAAIADAGAPTRKTRTRKTSTEG